MTTQKPHLKFTESELQQAYQRHLDKGYIPYRAQAFAEAELSIEQKEYAEIVSQPIPVYVPGVGNCMYTGD